MQTCNVRFTQHNAKLNVTSNGCRYVCMCGTFIDIAGIDRNSTTIPKTYKLHDLKQIAGVCGEFFTTLHCNSMSEVRNVSICISRHICRNGVTTNLI